METPVIDSLWYLCDPLTVNQAAALIAGFDPNLVCFYENEGITTLQPLQESDAARVKTVFSALKNAINAGKLRATMRHQAHQKGFDEYPNVGEDSRELDPSNADVTEDQHGVPLDLPVIIFKKEPDWARTTIERHNIEAWLLSKGVRNGFFFPETSSGLPDYLNPKDKRFAPKLAAAVNAWLAVTDPGKKSPKQALEKWLREHAAEFDLTDEDGKLNSKAIEECSKVANWNQTGGAPKTPS